MGARQREAAGARADEVKDMLLMQKNLKDVREREEKIGNGLEVKN